MYRFCRLYLTERLSEFLAPVFLSWKLSGRTRRNMHVYSGSNRGVCGAIAALQQRH